MNAPAEGRRRERGSEGSEGWRLARVKGSPQGPGAHHPCSGVCHGFACRKGAA